MEIPLNIDWQQILLHIFNFAILTGGLYFLLYSPIEKFIEKRNAYYRSLDSETNEKLESARAMEEKAKERLEHVDDEIREQRVKAAEELSRYAAEQKQAAAAEAEKIIADARKAAEAEKKAARASADKDLVRMTKAMAEKMVYASTDEAYSQFLDIAERNE